MKNLPKRSVERAITVFMAILIVIIFGVVSYTNLTTDLFPNMNIPYSVVITSYPGASPEEVEDAVTNPLEDALATTSNVKEVTSISQEHVSMIILEFNSDTNMDSAMIEMRETLDLATSDMPDMVGSPMIIKLNPDMMPVMQLSVTKGDLDQRELTTYVYDEVVPQLERVLGVASVSVSGAYESEVRVNIDDTNLEAKNVEIDDINQQLTDYFTAFNAAMLMADPNYVAGETPQIPNLDKDMVTGILQAQNFEYPLGYTDLLDDDYNGTYLVRIGEEFDSTNDISSLTVFEFGGIPESPMLPGFSVDGLTISMSEIADVEFVNANEKEYSKVNGNNAISLTIQKSSEFATTDVTDDINEVLNVISDTDEGTSFTILLDQGEYIDRATGTVADNLLYGALLALIILFIFLRDGRSTLIVAISIPISLLFAIVLIYFTGITLNIVSLGGLALGVGMLVDNSIVVMENIFRMKKLGYSNREASIQGAKQVAGAIVASTITTISVFVPVVFLEGFIREIFIEMAMTIAFSLFASLLIALTLVPAMSSRILKEDNKHSEEELANNEKTGFKGFYEKLLKGAFKIKYVILALVLVLFVGSIGLAISNGTEYFPTSDEGTLTISISNPVDQPLSSDEFFDLLDSLQNDILEQQSDNVDVVGVTLGSLGSAFMGMTNSNSASASVVLSDDRTMTTVEMEAWLNSLLATDYSNIEYSISGSQQMTTMLTGSGYQVELKGSDLEVLKAQAKNLANEMALVEGVISVDNGIGIPADEIKITVDKEAAIEHGYMTAIVGGMIAERLATEELVTTITQDGSIYEVYVYDQNSVSSDTTYTLDEVKNWELGPSLTNPMITVKVSDVATVEIVEGFSSISHTNGIRTVTVSATYDEDYNSTFVAQDLNSVVENYELPEGYSYLIEGENEEINEALETLVLAIVLAVALIYMIMASQFQSLKYPLIIMFTIPLAFTGGFLALFITGMPVSVVAMIGLIILVGVVVNNGIVLVDYINHLREDGMELVPAIIQAGKTRLRPIVMTALTTILALSTMAIGFGQGAEMMQPMAVTTIGGLIYATMLTLIVVPIMYYIFSKHGKSAMSILGLILILFVGAVAYMYFQLLWIIFVAAVLGLLLILNWIFSKKKKEVVVNE